MDTRTISGKNSVEARTVGDDRRREQARPEPNADTATCRGVPPALSIPTPDPHYFESTLGHRMCQIKGNKSTDSVKVVNNDLTVAPVHTVLRVPLGLPPTPPMRATGTVHVTAIQFRTPHAYICASLPFRTGPTVSAPRRAVLPQPPSRAPRGVHAPQRPSLRRAAAAARPPRGWCPWRSSRWRTRRRRARPPRGPRAPTRRPTPGPRAGSGCTAAAAPRRPSASPP